MTVWPKRVRIVEVGPRDGLQNEPAAIPTATKLEFIAALAAAGLRDIEATSFVHPRAIPQLADAAEVAAALVGKADDVVYSALVPNERGLERAMEAGIQRVCVFTAASETFAQKNINMSVADSLRVFGGLARTAVAAGMTVRGYVSTAFVCPYEGEVPAERVAEVSQELFAMGCDEVAVSDTIGAAAPNDIDRVLDVLLDGPSGESSGGMAVDRLALHLHDTYGTALANVCAGLRRGVTVFDSSAGGLGGCPYAPGAAGNLATGDLVYLLDRLGIETGVDLAGVVRAARVIGAVLERRLPGKQYQRFEAADGPSPPAGS